MPSSVSFRLKKLLLKALAAANKLESPYAVGGALAMAAHGYDRSTKDIDLFVDYEDRVAWIRELKRQGLLVETVFAGVHYVAREPRERDPEVKIDLLVPADEPEVSAVSVPDEGFLLGRKVDIFPLDLLVIAKYQSDRDKDLGDVDEMYERGLFDPNQVARIMARVDPDLASRFRKQYK